MELPLGSWRVASVLAALSACSAHTGTSGVRAYVDPTYGLVVDDAPEVVLGAPVTSPGALAVAASELDCTADLVTVIDYDDHIRAEGCWRVVYFLKKSRSQWERAGPVFQLTEADVMPDDIRGAPATEAVRIRGKLPSISTEQMYRLRAWENKATTHCIIRADGTVHHCIVFCDDPVMAEVVTESLKTWQFSPATVSGRAVPSRLTNATVYKAPKPECAQLSSSMERFRCKNAVDRIGSAPGD